MFCFCCCQIAEGVKPTLSELEKFEDTPESMDMECILYMIFKISCKQRKKTINYEHIHI